MPAALAALACLLLLAAAWARPLPARAGEQFTQEALAALKKPWKGDLEGMIKRRIIRALVVYNNTNYFLDGPRARGLTYEALKLFEKELNQRLKTRHLKVFVIMVPVGRDQLIPYLLEGRGDIAAASLTDTRERRRRVDFSAPFSSDVREVVVTGPGAPAIASAQDLSGKTVYVRMSSSYRRSLDKLNLKLKKAGKPPVVIEPADELLETEDILEMVGAGLVPITVADDYLANFWAHIFKGLKVHNKVALRTGGRIAWAFRKKSPKLKKAVDRFVAKHKQGTLMGNIIIKRYLQNTKWVQNAYGPDQVKRFERTVSFFKKYSKKYGFDWLMVTALAYQESGLDQSKRSPQGAVGVMQILPSTAASPPVEIKEVYKLEKNIHAGVKYLHYLYNRYFKAEPMNHFNKVLFTFASYNAGPARVAGLRQEAVKMSLDPDKWFNNVEVVAAKRIGRETVQYVSNIFKYYLAYRMLSEKQARREQVKEKVAK